MHRCWSRLILIILLFCMGLVDFFYFRAPLAAWLWMKTFPAWEKKEWHQIELLSQVVLFLQPHEINYIDLASWHMAWNASEDDAKHHHEVMRDYYLQRGRFFLERGIHNNPKSSLLYEHLGILLRDRYHDHVAAAAVFAKGALLPGAPSYLRRFAAYELAASPGHEAEAYTELQALYDESPSQRFPALIATMKQLEEKLRKEIHRDGSDLRNF